MVSEMAVEKKEYPYSKVSVPFASQSYLFELNIAAEVLLFFVMLSQDGHRRAGGMLFCWVLLNGAMGDISSQASLAKHLLAKHLSAVSDSAG